MHLFIIDSELKHFNNYFNINIIKKPLLVANECGIRLNLKIYFFNK